MSSSSFKETALGLLEYSTIKTVQIKNYKVGILFRSLQLAIILYIVVYSIVVKKGYQQLDQGVSLTTTKVKGMAYSCANQTIDPKLCNDTQTRIWDTIDYVIPAHEKDALFLVTNFIEITGQTQGVWDEDPAAVNSSVPAIPCSSNANCTRFATSTSGLVQGTCGGNGVCRILGWGPVETEVLDAQSQSLTGIPQLTVFVKNSILFPGFSRTFSNIKENDPAYKKFIQNCTFAPGSDCPIFTIDTILRECGIKNFSSTSSAAVKGAILGIELSYNCDLDKEPDRCDPVFKFYRLDLSTSLSSGYNFRYGNYYQNDNDTNARDFYKFSGLRIVFFASGVAGKFNFVPLFITIGSGLGLLSVATIIADLLVTKVLNRRQFYTQKKFEVVDDDVEYKRFKESINSKQSNAMNNALNGQKSNERTSLIGGNSTV